MIEIFSEKKSLPSLREVLPACRQARPLVKGRIINGKIPPLNKGGGSRRLTGDFHSLIIVLLIATLSSCQKDDAASTVPVISLKSMSKDTLVQFQDSLDIVIFYSDSDGDLGESNPDINSLYVKDSRLDTADYYHVQPLSPPNTALAIQGYLTIKVRNMFLLGNGGNENAYFSIKLKDRAGNWSNEVITDPVVITQ